MASGVWRVLRSGEHRNRFDFDQQTFDRERLHTYQSAHRRILVAEEFPARLSDHGEVGRLVS